MAHFKGPDVVSAFPNFRPNTSVLSILEEAFRRNGDTIAMVEGQTGKSASFKDILQQSSSIAAGLRSAGLTAGDYVIICGEKSIIAYSLFLGTMFTGATTIMFPIPHADILHQMTKGFQIKALFCDPDLLEPMMKSIARMQTQPLMVAVITKEDPVVKSLLKNRIDSIQIYDVKDVNKHTPLILFSSGTTGEPKGIQITDVYIQLCGIYFGHCFKTFLTASPLYWLTGVLFFISSTLHSYKLVFSNSAKPRDNLQLLETYKVDGWFTGTGSLSRYANESTLLDFDLMNLKQVFTGGECVLGSSVQEFFSKVLRKRINIKTMYGNTEAGMFSFAEIRQRNGHFETGFCGKTLPGVEIKIVDEDGRIVQIGVLGEICVKAVSITPGYWGKPELTSQSFHKDGFFRTGDAGIFDSEGNLYVRGRVGDLINYKGTKVSPSEVENILMSHEEVLDVAVVGKPHPSDIQHLIAFVVRVPGQHVSEQELEVFVNDKVEDNMKLRGGVNFLDVLPRTIIGKIQRKRLREISQNE